MKIYSVYELSVVKIKRENGTHQHFICKHDILNNYVEIFTNMKFKDIDEDMVKPLSEYYSILERYNYKKGRPLKLDMQQLLKKYNEINYVGLNLELDEEIIEEELTNRGIFERSKNYKKRNNIKE